MCYLQHLSLLHIRGGSQDFSFSAAQQLESDFSRTCGSTIHLICSDWGVPSERGILQQSAFLVLPASPQGDLDQRVDLMES